MVQISNSRQRIRGPYAQPAPGTIKVVSVVLWSGVAVRDLSGRTAPDGAETGSATSRRSQHLALEKSLERLAGSMFHNSGKQYVVRICIKKFRSGRVGQRHAEN